MLCRYVRAVVTEEGERFFQVLKPPQVSLLGECSLQNQLSGTLIDRYFHEINIFLSLTCLAIVSLNVTQLLQTNLFAITVPARQLADLE